MKAVNKRPGMGRAMAQGGQPRSQGKYSTGKRPGKKGKAGIPIYVGERVVGMVVGDVFIKRLAASKHFLRQPPAIAFDVSSLEDAQREGAKWVEVTDTESGKVYRAAIADIWADGKALNRGHGRQWFLPLGHWNRQASPAQLRLI